MKSTKWIKEERDRIQKDLDDLNQQIRDRNIRDEEMTDFKYQYKNGNYAEITVDQRMNYLLGKLESLNNVLS